MRTLQVRIQEAANQHGVPQTWSRKTTRSAMFWRGYRRARNSEMLWFSREGLPSRSYSSETSASRRISTSHRLTVLPSRTNLRKPCTRPPKAPARSCQPTGRSRWSLRAILSVDPIPAGRRHS